MSSERERLLNQPAKWTIGTKTVQVESLPAGAVTIILEKLKERSKFTGSQSMLEAFEEGVPWDKFLKNIYEVVRKDLLTEVKDDWQLYQLILIPAQVWREKRGDFSEFKESDFPVTQDDIIWNADETLLLEIWDEFWKRNPRFDRQKKMANVGL